MTQTVEAPELVDTNSPEHQAHMLNCPPDQASTAEWIALARAQKLTVKALCGYEFVPQRNPKTLRVCGACTDVAGILIFEGNN